MRLEKRRYQERIVEAFKQWISSDERFGSIILPTGCGKTISAALALNEARDKKILWAAHREELIAQAFDAIYKIIPNKNIDIEMADRVGNPLSDIIVGSVQTLARKRKHFVGFEPDIIVIDEFHHYSEDNVQYNGLINRWPKAKILGLTATPWRTSGEELPLGSVLLEMDIGTAVEKGYLVKPVPHTVDTNVSLANVKTKLGDFAIGDLSKEVNVDSRNQLIANKIFSLVEQGRQGILFGVDVAHAKSMYQILKNKIRAAEIYGDTPTEERRHIIELARNGEIDVLVNNCVLTEGLDLPHISFVCVARPTKSLGLFLQMVGRGLRKSPGKEDCIIVDVHDKIKLKQTRVTFEDLIIAGDLHGDKKRASILLDTQLELDAAKNIKNFPIFLKKNHEDRWQLDDNSFLISTWKISQHQWIATWTLEKDLPKTEEKFKTNPDGTTKIIKEYVPGEFEKIKTDKLFYICEYNGTYRLLEFVKNCGTLILVSDEKMFKSELDTKLFSMAKADGVLPLIINGAKWKVTEATSKQIQFVKNMISSKKIGYDLDINGLSKGEASNIIDQSRWQVIVNNKFGANNKEELIGYELDDV